MYYCYNKLTIFCNYTKQNKTQKNLSAKQNSFLSRPSFSLGNRALLLKLRLAPLARCEVGFYSMAGGDLFRNLWGMEMKPHVV